MPPRLVVVGLVVALWSVFAAPAGGCSCEADVVPKLARADAAVVATVAHKQADGDGWRYRVAVERVYKGTVGPEVELVSHELAGCDEAVDVAVGARHGFLLHGDGPDHELTSCSMATPDELAEAARAPSGRRAGVARLLVQGDMRGSSHLVALTARGRVLGSVLGSDGESVSVCPGGRFAVQAGERLYRIRLHDLRVVASSALPGDGSVDVRCLTASGRDAVALTYEFSNSDGPEKPLRLVRLRAGKPRTVTRAPGHWHSLGARELAVAHAGAVDTYAYRSGRRRTALRLSGVTGVTWSPDGRTLAVLASHAENSVLALRHPSGVLTRRAIALSGTAFDSATWTGPGRLAVIEIRRNLGHLYDTRLRETGRLRDWELPGSVGNGAVWTIDSGTLRRLALDGSGVRTVGRPIAGARTVTVIPGGTLIRAARPVTEPANKTCHD